MSIDSTSLAGKLLIAMPDMGDPRFERSVIFMCSHSAERAMGLIVNKTARDLKFNDLLKQLDIPLAPPEREITVHIGGPVDYGRGFVLHSPDYHSTDNTLDIDGGYGLTATLDILEDISTGDGPEQCLLTMGYAGWGAGQLENEIQRNGWLICDADSDLIFKGANIAKWSGALDLLGVDPLMLSPGGGSA
ncbi:YqgE/AlgH family protein [uncultured Litoreibacter sp.]|uniref:YqgE/AlgH family protein n=1 Tax=uncultured Litoreibacter sp. TaxID=1392394 RepID=UPI00262EF0DE|nr:YqgE/AlgH family protein [uncultured Litoreibacter sp.]